MTDGDYDEGRLALVDMLVSADYPILLDTSFISDKALEGNHPLADQVEFHRALATKAKGKGKFYVTAEVRSEMEEGVRGLSRFKGYHQTMASLHPKKRYSGRSNARRDDAEQHSTDVRNIIRAQNRLLNKVQNIETCFDTTTEATVDVIKDLILEKITRNLGETWFKREGSSAYGNRFHDLFIFAKAFVFSGRNHLGLLTRDSGFVTFFNQTRDSAFPGSRGNNLALYYAPKGRDDIRLFHYQ